MAPNLAVHLVRQFADPLAETDASPPPTVQNTSDWSVKLVAQAEKSWTVSGTSVLAAWILAFAGSLGIVLLYSWRRRDGNPVIYLPRYLALKQREPEVQMKSERGEWYPLIPSTADQGSAEGESDLEDLEEGEIGEKAEGRMCRSRSRSAKRGNLGEPFLGWLRPAWRDFTVEINVTNRKPSMERDKQLLESLGLDAFAFLEHLRLLRWLFALITVFVALPLLCANYFINTRTDWGSTAVTSARAISATGGNMTTAIGDLQLFNAANITGNALWVHISAELAVTMIVFLQVFIYSRRHERVIELWSDMNATEPAFKTILLTRLSIPIAHTSSESFVVEARNHITKLLGIPSDAEDQVEITVKRETVDKVGEAIKRLTFEERKKAETVITAAFITWCTANAAHAKLQQLKQRKDKKNKFKAERCPRGVCILSHNLQKDTKTIATQRITGAIARWAITLLNIIPVMFITLLMNLDAYVESNARLRTMRDTSTFWRTVFTSLAGVIPATVAALFLLALPYVMRFLSQWQGALSRGRLDKDVIRQMFIFLLLSKFVFFALMGIAYETYMNIKDQIGREDLSAVLGGLGDVPAKITRAYIAQSSYWLSFFPIKCVITCLQLIQIPRHFFHYWNKYFGSEKDVKPAAGLEKPVQPAEFDYAIEYTNILFGLVVALVYTPLAPIVAICGAIYFWTASVIYQNQLAFAEESVETDGRVWRVVMNRLLAALCFMQVLMVLTVLLKTQPFAASALPLGPRVAPSISAALPLLITAYLAYHVRRVRTIAQIISDRVSSDKSGNGCQTPRLQLERLGAGSKDKSDRQNGLFVALSQQKGLERLVPKRAKTRDERRRRRKNRGGGGRRRGGRDEDEEKEHRTRERSRRR